MPEAIGTIAWKANRVGDYFTMIIVVDTAVLDVPFASFKEALEAEVRSMSLACMMMHEDVVSSLHRI